MPASSDGVVTVTILPDLTTVRVAVDFTTAGSPLTALAASRVFTVTVSESLTGRVVRGLSRAMAPGAVAGGADHEAPFGVAQSYVATAYDVAGVLLASSAAAAITVANPVFGFATWIKSLTTPSLSVNVKTVIIPDWTAPIPEGVLRVIGRADPIVVQDIRQYETGTLEVLTQSPGAEAALTALLASPGPYLLQMPGFGTADRCVTVGSVVRKRPVNKATETWRTWSLPLTQVARPSVVGSRVSVPGHTYADSSAAWPLYSSRTGTYSSR